MVLFSKIIQLLKNKNQSIFVLLEIKMMLFILILKMIQTQNTLYLNLISLFIWPISKVSHLLMKKI